MSYAYNKYFLQQHARTHPDIDMKEAVGKYEFSSISRAVSIHEFLLPCKYKSKLLQKLETMPEITLEKENSADPEGITEVLVMNQSNQKK